MGEEGKYPFLTAQFSVSHILTTQQSGGEIFSAKLVIRSLCRLMTLVNSFKMSLVKPEKVKGEYPITEGVEA